MESCVRSAGGGRRRVIVPRATVGQGVPSRGRPATRASVSPQSSNVIGVKALLVGDDYEVIHYRLRDQHPIERVAARAGQSTPHVPKPNADGQADGALIGGRCIEIGDDGSDRGTAPHRGQATGKACVSSSKRTPPLRGGSAPVQWAQGYLSWGLLSTRPLGAREPSSATIFQRFVRATVLAPR
jgi:hypothetical protein